MKWHFEPTRYTARLYEPGKSFEAGDPFIAVAQIDRRRNGEVYIHAAMTNESSVSITQWRQLAAEAVAQVGATVVKAEIGGKKFTATAERIERG